MVLGHHASLDRRIVLNDLIGERFDPRQLFLGEGFGWVKSKRSRSGATSDPFCATWSPSTWRSASCRICVAE
ncbi:MAG: hypothetical protein U1E25_06945 [Methylocystis sp.]